MFKQKDESYYEEGNGYRINDIPSDVNYNTCSVKYTLNNDFSENPRAQFRDSTNIHSRRSHTDVNASNNMQRSSGASCSRPMSNPGTTSMGNHHTMNTQRPYGTGNQGSIHTQRTSSSARPATKKASPFGLLILPVIFLLVIFLSIKGEATASIIPFIVIVAGILSTVNKAKRHK